jgi:hypothetical protein
VLRSGGGDTTPGPVSFEDHWETAFVRPAGLVWSTASDQCKLAAFLIHGDEAVLPAELHSLIATEHVGRYPDIPGSYGYGLMVDYGAQFGADDYREVRLWSHGGNTLTHTSTFYLLPDQDFAISILSNGWGDDFTGSVVTAALTLADLPPSSPIPDSAPPDIDYAASFAGTYTDFYNVGEVFVTATDGGLSVSMPDVDAAGVTYAPELTPVSTHVWLMEIEGTQYDISFYEGEDGEAWMRNRAFVAHRPAEVLPVLPAPPVPPEVRAQRIREALVKASLQPRSLHPLKGR